MRCHSALLLPALFCAPLQAHEFTITNVTIVFPGNGMYQIDMSVDADALALGLPPETESAIVVARMNELPDGEFEDAVALARQTTQRRVRVRFDGEKAIPDVEFLTTGPLPLPKRKFPQCSERSRG